MIEIEYLYEVGACSDDIMDEIGIYQRGHVSPWKLRYEAWSHVWQVDDVGWPKREWWRDIPFSIMYPDSEPCGGEESILFVPCKRTEAGAYPVTVLRFRDD